MLGLCAVGEVLQDHKRGSMAAATEYAQTAFSPSSSFSAARSPDTASPIYPERAIRPLPRNRLKSKLSPEQASTIQFPPEPPPIPPTLSFNIPETSAPNHHRHLTNGHAHRDHDHDHDHDHDPDDEDYDHCQHRRGHRLVHHHCTCHEDADSGEDEVEFDHPDYRYPPAPMMTNGVAVKPVDSLQRRLVEAARASGKSPPTGSTASSADGYESFENTSNKKKRKIPLSGASSMHQSSLSAEMANMGISNTHRNGAPDDISVHGMTAAELEQYHAQAAHASNGGSGTGISGAGRGRYGRQEARHRKPLAHAVNTSNLHNSRHPNGTVRSDDAADSGVENTGGIISQAIKTAAEQGPLTPAVKGRENFTFTCESDSATKMVDQHPAHAAPYGTPTPQRHAAAPGKSTHGTQTTPSHRGGHPPINNAARPPPPPANHAPPTSHHHQQQHQQQPAPSPKPRPRRNPTREYALQAAQRKKNQQYQNYHHQPKPQDVYICMFCEYEDIYGVPPYALIRQYEIKDRKERKKAAEKRRLLEKAKMKGRKNKKGAKGKNNAVNNAANPAPPNQPQNYDPNLPPPDGEEFYDDEEEDYEGDEYDPVGEDEEFDNEGYYPPPPAPASTPAMPRLERVPG